jgi:hypothetical protein
MLRNSLAKGAGGRWAAEARSRRFVRSHAMAHGAAPANVACGATRLPATMAYRALQQLSRGSPEPSRAGRIGRVASGAQRRGARPRHSFRAGCEPAASALHVPSGSGGTGTKNQSQMLIAGAYSFLSPRFGGASGTPPRDCGRQRPLKSADAPSCSANANDKMTPIVRCHNRISSPTATIRSSLRPLDAGLGPAQSRSTDWMLK